MNLYTYVANNPINFTDPEGTILLAIPPIAAKIIAGTLIATTIAEIIESMRHPLGPAIPPHLEPCHPTQIDPLKETPVKLPPPERIKLPKPPGIRIR